MVARSYNEKKIVFLIDTNVYEKIEGPIINKETQKFKHTIKKKSSFIRCKQNMAKMDRVLF